MAENSVENDAVRKLKLETASIVENIVRNLDADISSIRDLKILSDSILQREAMIKHLQYTIAHQNVTNKPKLISQEQQTSPENFHLHQAQQTITEDLPETTVDVVIDKTLNLKEVSTQTVKNIDIANTQTDEDQVQLSNFNKISNLESCLFKMNQNQDLLLSELNIQRKNNFVLQEEILMTRKKMADVIFANNLYHITLIEQNCSLPDDAEELLSSLSNGGQAEDLHPSSIIKHSKEQDAITHFQKVQVDTKTIKKEQVTNQSPEDKDIATVFPMKEDSTQLPKKKDPSQPLKEANKTLSKELAWISKMSQVLTKLEKKFSIPLEKRKPRMFKRKLQINHIIPKPFRAIFHHLATPELHQVTLPDPYPSVDWSTLRLKPTLPNPEDCPVYSASMDPDVYQMTSLRPPSSIFLGSKPFGALPGYKTTEGVVSVPASPVQGWTYSPEARRWLLHASPNPVRRRTVGRGCPGTSRGEEKRGKKLHYLP